MTGLWCLFQELGRRDSYRGAVKDKKMAEDATDGGKKKQGKEKMEDLKKELTLDDHLISWEEFHARHEGSNRATVRLVLFRFQLNPC